jgi:hypothetical protein
MDLRLEGLALSSYQASGEMYRPSTNTSAVLQFSGSRGSHPPRSSIKTFLPEGARCRASVPPPAPVPMTMTS